MLDKEYNKIIHASILQPRIFGGIRDILRSLILHVGEILENPLQSVTSGAKSGEGFYYITDIMW